jgi:hypothetical protein
MTQKPHSVFHGNKDLIDDLELVAVGDGPLFLSTSIGWETISPFQRFFA